jgi:hypothetical protein
MAYDPNTPQIIVVWPELRRTWTRWMSPDPVTDAICGTDGPSSISLGHAVGRRLGLGDGVAHCASLADCDAWCAELGLPTLEEAPV